MAFLKFKDTVSYKGTSYQAGKSYEVDSETAKKLLRYTTATDVASVKKQIAELEAILAGKRELLKSLEKAETATAAPAASAAAANTPAPVEVAPVPVIPNPVHTVPPIRGIAGGVNSGNQTGTESQ